MRTLLEKKLVSNLLTCLDFFSREINSFLLFFRMSSFFSHFGLKGHDYIFGCKSFSKPFCLKHINYVGLKILKILNFDTFLRIKSHSSDFKEKRSQGVQKEIRKAYIFTKCSFMEIPTNELIEVLCT